MSAFPPESSCKECEQRPLRVIPRVHGPTATSHSEGVHRTTEESLHLGLRNNMHRSFPFTAFRVRMTRSKIWRLRPRQLAPYPRVIFVGVQPTPAPSHSEGVRRTTEESFASPLSRQNAKILPLHFVPGWDNWLGNSTSAGALHSRCRVIKPRM